jgi:hypothetical protein
MDGSLGGEIIRRVRLGVTALPYPIGDFALPQLSATSKLDFVVEFSAVGLGVYDIFTVGKTGGSSGWPPSIIYPRSNAIITFVAGGTSGATWLTTAGTEHLFDHTFRSDVTISGSVIIPGSTIPIDTSWTSYTPVWTAASVNPVIGNGSLQGWYKVIGKTCCVIYAFSYTYLLFCNNTANEFGF